MPRIAKKTSAGLSRKKQAGNMMLSSVIALIISAIVTAAAYLGFKYVDDAKVDNEIGEIASLRASTIQLAQGRGTDFTDIDLATIAGLNFFPNQRVSGTGTSTVVLNQWKGTITVAPATVVSTNDSIIFTYTGVPTYACKSLSTPVSNIATEITIGGTKVQSNGVALNLASAIARCNAGADNVKMAYTVSR